MPTANQVLCPVVAVIFFVFGLFSYSSTLEDVAKAKYLKPQFKSDNAIGATANATQEIAAVAEHVHNGVLWLACGLLVLVLHFLSRLHAQAERTAAILERWESHSR